MPNIITPTTRLKNLYGKLERDGQSVSFNISRRGVPYILVNKNGIKYSIAYFRSSKIYRIFYPYLNTQKRIDFGTHEAVCNYFDSLPPANK